MSRKRSAVPTEAFLSHSSKNGVFADRLASVLSCHKVRTFYSKKNIRGAQQWHDEIGAALKRCDWFLLVGAVESQVQAEAEFRVVWRDFVERQNFPDHEKPHCGRKSPLSHTPD